MAKVTIIVPIYKVEKYLRKCFESLLKQSAEDCTILAVNDGSPDNCGAIIEEYVKKYPNRITGIKKENGGYGSVLQLAISLLKTPYFLICDPDDTLMPEAVQTLLSIAELSNADISIGAKMIVHEEDTGREYDPSYNTAFAKLKANTVYNRDTEAFNDLFFIDPSPHAKLYRKELAQKIVFPERVGYTDNLLFYVSLLNSDKVIYTDKPLAEYLVNRTGNTMTDVSVKAMNGQILVFKQIMNETKDIKDIPDMFYYRMFESFKFMLYQSRRVAGDRKDYEEVLDYLETYLSKLLPYQDKIKPLYKKYSSAGFIEKMRDEALFSSKRSASAYEGLKKKMLNEFKEK